MRGMRSAAGALAFALAAAALLPAAAAPAEQPGSGVVRSGKRVSIVYTLRLEDGTIVESNQGEAPFAYTQGGGDLLPGLERALDDMAVGESKQGTLSAADAFGEIDAELFVEVETARIPEADRRVGAWLDYRDQSGERQRVRVHELRGDRIVVDMNHPYAGSAIRYEVEVVKIE
jgi:FKBP-type peptidyl-prolyl cis-trans isomerase 2